MPNWVGDLEVEFSSLFGKNCTCHHGLHNFLTLAHTGNQRQSRIIVGSLPGMTQKSKYGSIHQAVRDVQVLSLHCEFVLIGRDQGASYKGGMA